MSIPELEAGCGSWIIVSKATGQPVIELYNRELVEHVNQDKYKIYTALQWLQKFNLEVKEGKHYEQASVKET